uniref:Uncharacterized protein n=1 Tax=viral metagenome TaxID=1070528 RepID=A0A6C0KSZ6_9ZZZZ
MFLSSICAPALIYIGFSLIQIFIDIYSNKINEAFLKFIFMLIFTLIINILCDLGFVVIAWIFVFIPIIMMTIISTLLLHVFGLDPKSKDLKSNIRNASDGSNNDIELKGSELLNQQKYAYEYDQYKNEERIDRDKLRHKLYDNIDEVYKLPLNSDSVYDLSNNPAKYFIVDKVLNYFSEFSFAKQLVNSQLYHTIFAKSLAQDNILYNDYISSRPSSINYALPTVSIAGITSATTSATTTKPTKPNKYKSYYAKYDNEYKVDGYDLFKRNKYESVKRDLEAKDPQVTSIKINAVLEAMWNKLSAAEQNAWNNSSDAGKTTDYKLKYDDTDLTSYDTHKAENIISSLSKYAEDRPCPINETPLTYKSKTGLVCYEICPPGKIRNAAGVCAPVNKYN